MQNIINHTSYQLEMKLQSELKKSIPNELGKTSKKYLTPPTAGVYPKLQLTCNLQVESLMCGLLSDINLMYDLCYLKADVPKTLLVLQFDTNPWFLFDVIIFQNKKNINLCEVLVLSDVRPSSWAPCPSAWAPTWRLHTKLYIFGWNTLRITRK